MHKAIALLGPRFARATEGLYTNSTEDPVSMSSEPETTEYLVGEQRLIIGDAANMRAVEDDSIDFFITSPPYWNLKNYGTPGEIGQSDYAGYLDSMNAVWAECFRVGTEKSVLAINVNSRRVKKQFYPIAFDIAARMRGWTLHDVIVWYIPNALPQPNSYIERLLDNKFEYILIFTKNNSHEYKFHKPRVPQKYAAADPRNNKNASGRCLGNILRIPAYRPPNIKKMNYHVAAFPEELVAFFLECYTDPGDAVLDPFVGSGTTLKVANVMKRRGVGVEINPQFADLIQTRVQEPWQVPDWKTLDIIHSATPTTGMAKPRKAHFGRVDKDQSGLFEAAE